LKKFFYRWVATTGLIAGCRRMKKVRCS